MPCYTEGILRRGVNTGQEGIAVANSSKTAIIGFRGMPEDKEEWDRWRTLAETSGIKNFRDWLYPRIRQSLAPKPTRDPVATNTVTAYRRGYYVGAMVGRLDWVFEEGHETDLDRGAIRAWCERHPDCVADVLSVLTAKPYGVRFHAWWVEVMGHQTSAPAVRTLSARP